jgi:hypothetical protein
VRDRQDDVEFVINRHLSDIGGRFGAEQEVFVGQHHALRGARGARCVNKNRDLPGGAFFNGLGDGRLVERTDADISERTNVFRARAVARRVAGRFPRNSRGEEHPPSAAVITNLVELAK